MTVPVKPASDQIAAALLRCSPTSCGATRRHGVGVGAGVGRGVGLGVVAGVGCGAGCGVAVGPAVGAGIEDGSASMKGATEDGSPPGPFDMGAEDPDTTPATLPVGDGAGEFVGFGDGLASAAGEEPASEISGDGRNWRPTRATATSVRIPTPIAIGTRRSTPRRRRARPRTSLGIVADAPAATPHAGHAPADRAQHLLQVDTPHERQSESPTLARIATGPIRLPHVPHDRRGRAPYAEVATGVRLRADVTRSPARTGDRSCSGGRRVLANRRDEVLRALQPCPSLPGRPRRQPGNPTPFRTIGRVPRD